MTEEANFKYAASLIKIISLVIALMLIAISSSAFTFFSAAMLPTIISIFVDRNNHRCASGTICTFNLIGVIPYLVKIWESPNIEYVSKQVLSEISTWLIIYGACFVGILLYISLPNLIVRIVEAKNLVLASKYRKKVKDISEEWGLDYEEK